MAWFNGTNACSFFSNDKVDSRPHKLDDSAVVLLQSNIEYFVRENTPAIEEPTVSDELGEHKGLRFQLIISPIKQRPASNYLYWCESQGLFTGVAFSQQQLYFPIVQATTYGTFKEQLQCTYMQ